MTLEWGSTPENGVGDIFANWFVEAIVEVERPSSRIMKVKIVIVNEVWEVVSCYYPQVGRPTAETDGFYKLLDQVVSDLYPAFGKILSTVAINQSKEC